MGGRVQNKSEHKGAFYLDLTYLSISAELRLAELRNPNPVLEIMPNNLCIFVQLL